MRRKDPVAALFIQILAFHHPSNQFLAVLLTILFPYLIQRQNFLRALNDCLDVNLALR